MLWNLVPCIFAGKNITVLRSASYPGFVRSTLRLSQSNLHLQGNTRPFSIQSTPKRHGASHALSLLILISSNIMGPTFTRTIPLRSITVKNVVNTVDITALCPWGILNLGIPLATAPWHKQNGSLKETTKSSRFKAANTQLGITARQCFALFFAKRWEDMYTLTLVVQMKMVTAMAPSSRISIAQGRGYKKTGLRIGCFGQEVGLKIHTPSKNKMNLLCVTIDVVGRSMIQRQILGSRRLTALYHYSMVFLGLQIFLL